ncbi:superoxide dismutase family protein [Streptomyces sp. NPDC005336]|uniref:superoxide dismutase family protein n=1 Tax=unclassified Streptomyces TaxID=2593676 RepID=UPI0033A490D1
MSLVTAAAAVAASLAIVSPAVSPAVSPDMSPADNPPNPAAFVLERFQPASQAHGQSGAVTYDKALVPTTAVVVVAEMRIPHGMRDHDHHHEMHDEGQRDHRKPYGGTYVFLALRGVAPNHHFGIHVHTKPCGTTPDSSGPHYQNVKDPKQPSTNPKYANPRNEVWLDLTTNGRGDGRSQTVVKWHFRPGEARSVVIHEHATSTQAGKAGMAGDRVACVNVPFK